MNSIRYEHEGNCTSSQILMNSLGVGAAVIMLTAAQPQSIRVPTPQESRSVIQRSYSLTSEAPTFDAFASMTGEYMPGTVGLEEAVGNVYARLLVKQEKLGAAFEKVLYENLWDLYES